MHSWKEADVLDDQKSSLIMEAAVLVHALYSDPWFERVLTYQECVLPAKIIFVMKSNSKTTCDGDDLCAVAEALHGLVGDGKAFIRKSIEKYYGSFFWLNRPLNQRAQKQAIFGRHFVGDSLSKI